MGWSLYTAHTVQFIEKYIIYWKNIQFTEKYTIYWKIYNLLKKYTIYCKNIQFIEKIYNLLYIIYNL